MNYARAPLAGLHGRQVHQHAKCAARRHQANTQPDTCPELRRGLSEDAENYQVDSKIITRAWLGYAAAGRDLRRRPTTLPRPSRSSKKTRSPTLPIPNEGGLDYDTNDGS